MMLMVTASTVFGQVSDQNPTPDNSQAQMTHDQIAVTGCLTKNSHNELELVDQEGVHNLPYSSTVNLASYVGKEVTIVGRRAATPSSDTGGHRAPHFQVSKVQSTSGDCKK
jgi:hypothetical protein